MTDETQNDDLYISTDIESAIIQGNRERFDELIDDADLSHQSDNDSTLLHKAAIVGEIELASELIDRGIELDAQDYEGKTPLHRALELEEWEIAELLITNGADVNVLDTHGRPPLNDAIRHTRRDNKFVTMLLEHGADPHRSGESAKSPLMMARDLGFVDIIELLENDSEE